MQVSKRVAQISPSLTLAITAKANKMKADGLDVASFGAGEPDFTTPAYIIEAAKEALDKGMTKYTPVSGIMPLRKAIADTLKRDQGLEYAPSQITVCNGGKQSLRNTFESILNPGDEVILPSPYWLTYPELIKLSGGTVVYVASDAKNDFKITPEQLKNAITEKTKAFVFTSPSNPTGTVYTEEEIKALAEICDEADIYIVSDEIYEKLVYDGIKHYSIARVSKSVQARTIICSGLSKTYAMTGWRVGYTCAPPDVAKAIDSLQSHTTSNANSIAQYAAYIGLTDIRGEDFLATLNGTFDKRRKLIVRLINDIPNFKCNTPKGAFYVMMDVSYAFGKSYNGKKINNVSDFCDILLEEKLVTVVAGDAFGAPDYVRLSYATNEGEIEKGISRIKEFEAGLK